MSESYECEKCGTWKKVLSQTLGSSSTELLERMVEKELASSREAEKK